MTLRVVLVPSLISFEISCANDRMQDAVLLVDFAADSRSAVPSIRENFTDVLRGRTYIYIYMYIRSSGFSKVTRRKEARAHPTHLIVDSPPTREIDSRCCLLTKKCNYVLRIMYAVSITMCVFPPVCASQKRQNLYNILPSRLYSK